MTTKVLGCTTAIYLPSFCIYTDYFKESSCRNLHLFSPRLKLQDRFDATQRLSQSHIPTGTAHPPENFSLSLD